MKYNYSGKRLLSLQEFCDYTGIGPTKAKKWGQEIDAVRHIGRRTFYDRLIIDKAIDTVCKSQG